MPRLVIVVSMLVSILMLNAEAQPITVDPESIVPLPDTFDMEMPGPDGPTAVPNIASRGNVSGDVRPACRSPSHILGSKRPEQSAQCSRQTR